MLAIREKQEAGHSVDQQVKESIPKMFTTAFHEDLLPLNAHEEEHEEDCTKYSYIQADKPLEDGKPMQQDEYNKSSAYI